MIKCPYCGDSMHLNIEHDGTNGVIICEKCNITVELKTRKVNHNEVFRDLEGLGVLYLKTNNLRINQTQGYLTLAAYIAEQKKVYEERMLERKIILNSVYGSGKTLKRKRKRGLLYKFTPVSHSNAKSLLKFLGKLYLKHTGLPVSSTREYEVLKNYIATCENAEHNWKTVLKQVKDGEIV